MQLGRLACNPVCCRHFICYLLLPPLKHEVDPGLLLASLPCLIWQSGRPFAMLQAAGAFRQGSGTLAASRPQLWCSFRDYAHKVMESPCRSLHVLITMLTCCSLAVLPDGRQGRSSYHTKNHCRLTDAAARQVSTAQVAAPDRHMHCHIHSRNFCAEPGV